MIRKVSLIIIVLFALLSSAQAATRTVTNCANSGAGSLRDAITGASAGDVIDFNIPDTDPGSEEVEGGHVWRIRIATSIAFPQANLHVDGTTQPNDDNPYGPAVVISSETTAGSSGFYVGTNGNTIEGLTFNYFNGGYTLDFHGNNNTVRGCYIGIDATGEVDASNATAGIWLNGDNNLVGGDTVAARNIISGNGNGLYIWAADGSNNNTIEGNYIGVNRTGTRAVANDTGIAFASAGGTGNLIGGTTAEARNVISGNSTGISFYATGTDSNEVKGNYIGTDASGASGIGGQYYGVYISGGAKYNMIGGTTSEARNVLSGNSGYGIFIGGAGSDGNKIKGNYIGTNKDGNGTIGNPFGGIYIYGGARYNIVGGTTEAERNVISGHTICYGVQIYGTGTNSNEVKGNYIGLDATGSTAIPNASGVFISSGPKYNLIGGTSSGERNIVSGNGNYNIYIDGIGTDSNEVQGNYIGLNAAGSAGVTNSTGVYIASAAKYNLIGGSTAEARNVISGNANGSGYGVWINSNGTNSNEVKGNYIGLNAAGSSAIANLYGVVISSVAKHNQIGGSATGEGNIISGNTTYGIQISQCNSNEVYGNYIGTNLSGNSARANGKGIYITGGVGNTIGGTEGKGNLISGNTSHGIEIVEAASIGNLIKGNFIGVNAAGTGMVSNGGSGVYIYDADYNIIGGATTLEGNVISSNNGYGIFMGGIAESNEVMNNYIGTDTSQTSTLLNGYGGIGLFGGTRGSRIEQNVIARNNGSGVLVSGSNSYYNRITRNSIYENSQKGIALIDSANEGISNPVINYAKHNASNNITIIGGTADANSVMEVFEAEDPPDSTGQGEGKTYLGSTESSGAGAWSFPISGHSSGTVCATATNGNNDTSEFSLNKTISSAPPTLEGIFGPTYTKELSIQVEAINPSTDCYEVLMSEDPGFAGASWVAYSNPVGFTLSPGEGQKTVYYKARDIVSLESIVFSDSITYDATAPGDIASFTASLETSQIRLSWTNPSDADYAGCMVRYRNDTYPTDPLSGTLLTNEAGSPGAPDSYIQSSPTEIAYYYKAFAYDLATNYAGGVTAMVVTHPGVVLKDRTSGSTTHTDSRIVSLEALGISGTPAQMVISESNSFSGATWKTYQNPTTFEVSSGDGTKEVYYKVRDSYLIESTTSEGTIILDLTAPTVAVIAPNGGENISGISNTYNIRWSASDVFGLATNPITLKFSSNEGTSWSQIVSNEANTGSYSWTVPQIDSILCLVSVEAVDAAGNRGRARSASTFTIDSTRPTVLLITPESGAASVKPTAEVYVLFSEAMSRETVQSAYSLTANSAAVSGAFSWSSDDQTLTFDPAAALGYSTTCAVSIGTGAADLAGNGLSTAFSSYFTVEARGDYQAPEVMIKIGPSLIASNDYIESAPKFDITITDNTTIDSDSVKVYFEDSQVDYALVVYKKKEMQLYYQPAGTLDDETVRKHSIKVTVNDVRGNATEKDITGLKVAAAASTPKLVGSMAVYPSTFSPSRDRNSLISFTLNKDAGTTLMLFGPSGELVWTRKFTAGMSGAAAGYNSVNFNGISDLTGGALANGIYVCHIVVDGKIIGKTYIVIYE